jgi:hypothetical protein
MMSSKGRQEIPEKQIVNPPTIEQRIRKDISRAGRTRDCLAHVMSLKTVGDKQEAKPAAPTIRLGKAFKKVLTGQK